MRFAKFVVVCLVCMSAVCYAADPIQNFLEIPIPANLDGSSPNAEEVKTAIIKGCRARGWTPVVNGANSIIASILVRSKHYAEVEIVFTGKTYSIKYRSSRDLDYDEKDQTIHRNYNKWVVMLSATIQREFGVRSQGY